MLSAVIPAARSYPAMDLAVQLDHQGCVQPNPLVLKLTPLKLVTITADRDRPGSRRSEPSSRTTLIGEQPNPWDRLQATALPHGTAGSLGPTFVTACPVGLAVKPACALALSARFPSVLSRPLHSSVTFLEETAPVKLPSSNCPAPRFMGVAVRPQTCSGWYFTLWLCPSRNKGFNASHLYYAEYARDQ